MADKLIAHKRTTPIKKRSSSCYQKKVDKIIKWYNNLLKCREKEVINPNTKQPVKNVELVWISKDGKTVLVEYSIIPICNAKGEINSLSSPSFNNVGTDVA